MDGRAFVQGNSQGVSLCKQSLGFNLTAKYALPRSQDEIHIRQDKTKAGFRVMDPKMPQSSMASLEESVFWNIYFWKKGRIHSGNDVTILDLISTENNDEGKLL
jgi:hypothetical protein